MVDEEDDDVFWVWDINRHALEAFLALETQWRVTTVGGGFAAASLIWLGLDYQAVDVVLRRFGFDGAKIFDDIRAMEAAALDVLKSEG